MYRGEESNDDQFPFSTFVFSKLFSNFKIQQLNRCRVHILCGGGAGPSIDCLYVNVFVNAFRCFSSSSARENKLSYRVKFGSVLLVVSLAVVVFISARLVYTHSPCPFSSIFLASSVY